MQILLNQRLAKILTTVYKVVNRQGVSESLCDPQAAQAQIARSYSFPYGVYANVQREKRDNYYMLGYAKRDLCTAPYRYGGVVLQR